MRVRSDYAPNNAFTFEPQPKKPGFVLVRFYENVAPFEEATNGLTVSGFEYDEYQIEFPDAVELSGNILNDYEHYIGMAKQMELEPETEITQTDAKIAELGAACEAAIFAGVGVETTQGIEHFSLTLNDQTNIGNLMIQAQVGAPCLYHADGKLCRMFTVDEIQAIGAAAIAHKTYHTTLCNHLNTWVRRTEDAAELAKIHYGSALPDDLAASFAALMGGDDG